MMIDLKLSPSQWKLLASAFSNMSQAVMLFSAAASFVPEVVGLFLLTMGVKMSKRSK